MEEKKEDIRGAIIRKNLNDLNSYMKDGVVEESNYDQIMNLYENERGDVKVDMYFYTTKSGEEIFKLVGGKCIVTGKQIGRAHV